MTEFNSYHKKTERHSAFACGAFSSTQENAMSNLSRRSLVGSRIASLGAAGDGYVT